MQRSGYEAGLWPAESRAHKREAPEGRSASQEGSRQPSGAHSSSPRVWLRDYAICPVLTGHRA